MHLQGSDTHFSKPLEAFYMTSSSENSCSRLISSAQDMGDPHTAWLHFGRPRFEEMRGLSPSNDAMVDELVDPRRAM